MMCEISKRFNISKWTKDVKIDDADKDKNPNEVRLKKRLSTILIGNTKKHDENLQPEVMNMEDHK